MALAGIASAGSSAMASGMPAELAVDRAFDINDPAFCTDEFRMFEFKVG